MRSLRWDRYVENMARLRRGDFLQRRTGKPVNRRRSDLSRVYSTARRRCADLVVDRSTACAVARSDVTTLAIVWSAHESLRRHRLRHAARDRATIASCLHDELRHYAVEQGALVAKWNDLPIRQLEVAVLAWTAARRVRGRGLSRLSLQSSEHHGSRVLYSGTGAESPKVLARLRHDVLPQLDLDAPRFLSACVHIREWSSAQP